MIKTVVFALAITLVFSDTSDPVARRLPVGRVAGEDMTQSGDGSDLQGLRSDGKGRGNMSGHDDGSGSGGRSGRRDGSGRTASGSDKRYFVPGCGDGGDCAGTDYPNGMGGSGGSGGSGNLNSPEEIGQYLFKNVTAVKDCLDACGVDPEKSGANAWITSCVNNEPACKDNAETAVEALVNDFNTCKDDESAKANSKFQQCAVFGPVLQGLGLGDMIGQGGSGGQGGMGGSGGSGTGGSGGSSPGPVPAVCKGIPDLTQQLMKDGQAIAQQLGSVLPEGLNAVGALFDNQQMVSMAASQVLGGFDPKPFETDNWNDAGVMFWPDQSGGEKQGLFINIFKCADEAVEIFCKEILGLDPSKTPFALVVGSGPDYKMAQNGIAIDSNMKATPFQPKKEYEFSFPKQDWLVNSKGDQWKRDFNGASIYRSEAGKVDIKGQTYNVTAYIATPEDCINGGSSKMLASSGVVAVPSFLFLLAVYFL